MTEFGAAPLRASIHERFERKYIPEPNSGCWIWTAASTKNRYGVIYGSFYIHGHGVMLAHRASWYLAKREMPPSHLKVCHSCDLGLCVNPDHLWIGSQKENMQDCFAKGRMDDRPRAEGSKNGASILTEEQVLSILQDQRSGVELAELYGCSASNIYAIRNRKTWKSIL